MNWTNLINSSVVANSHLTKRRAKIRAVWNLASDILSFLIFRSSSNTCNFCCIFRTSYVAATKYGQHPQNESRRWNQSRWFRRLPRLLLLRQLQRRRSKQYQKLWHHHLLRPSPPAPLTLTQTQTAVLFAVLLASVCQATENRLQL